MTENNDEFGIGHLHDDDVAQYNHDVYHGYATWYPTQSPSYSPMYNQSGYISNGYEQVYFVKPIWCIVAYFLINRY